MPIREFKCPRGHVTERILQGDADSETKSIQCRAEMPDHEPNYIKKCGMRAKRVEMSTHSILSEKTKFLSDVKG